MQMVQIAQPLRTLALREAIVVQAHLHHDNSEPQTGTEPLHHHIGWNLSHNVEWKEDGEGMVVLDDIRSFERHVQILLQTKEFGITDIRAVQEGKTAGKSVPNTAVYMSN